MAHLHMIFMDNLCVIGQKDIAGFVFPSLASTVTFRSEATCFNQDNQEKYIHYAHDESLSASWLCNGVCVGGGGHGVFVCYVVYLYK